MLQHWPTRGCVRLHMRSTHLMQALHLATALVTKRRRESLQSMSSIIVELADPLLRVGFAPGIRNGGEHGGKGPGRLCISSHLHDWQCSLQKLRR